MLILFLGTSGSVPTSTRNLPSVVLKYGPELLMFDCGEGTQRQAVSTGLSLARKMKIFISHMHGDHVLGVPGIIQSMALMGRTKKLEIYGPPGLRRFLRCIHKTVEFGLNFPLEVHEVNWGKVVEDASYEIRAARADHVVTCLSYALVEKPRPGRFDVAAARRLKIPEGPLWKKLQLGKPIRIRGTRIEPEEVVGPSRRGLKITYATDTRPSSRIISLAESSDVLIHDATFDRSLKEKARLDGHSTAEEAAQVAMKANAKKLILTHISARYRDSKLLRREARKFFRNSFVAEDLMRIDL